MASWSAHNVTAFLLDQRSVPEALRGVVAATLESQAIDGSAALVLDKDDVLRLFRDLPYGHAVKIWACIHSLQLHPDAQRPKAVDDGETTITITTTAEASSSPLPRALRPAGPHAHGHACAPQSWCWHWGQDLVGSGERRRFGIFLRFGLILLVWHTSGNVPPRQCISLRY